MFKIHRIVRIRIKIWILGCEFQTLVNGHSQLPPTFGASAPCPLICIWCFSMYPLISAPLSVSWVFRLSTSLPSLSLAVKGQRRKIKKIRVKLGKFRKDQRIANSLKSKYFTWTWTKTFYFENIKSILDLLKKDNKENKYY